jgi:tetratricopeptide (TPR) repeat protein
MKTLRLEVFEQTSEQFHLRFFGGDSALPKTRPIAAQDLRQFVETMQQDYARGVQLQALGERLFNWLNGQESALQGFQENTVLYIPNTHDLQHLAWELLHFKQFLCMNQNKPFTPLRLVSEEKQGVEPAKRPLRVLFMASSPETVKPVLDFEKEEALILEATQKLSLELVVEESGSLAGLKEWLSYDDESMRFDVVHLTGHAGFEGGKAVFVLEDELGQAQLANADEIAEVFSYKGHFPRLLFLSGCETAQAHDNSLPSLCEALVQAGVPAVLGWAKPVKDFIGSFTAQKLYAYLADGMDLARAVAKTRRDLYVYEIEKQINSLGCYPQWHLLRFYSDCTPLEALVIKGRAQPKRDIRQVFLDKKAQSEVCPREKFVGRRRLLQRALRILRSQQGRADYADGVLLSGMGGLGKSSLALRICQRLEVLLSKRFVWVGKIEETALRAVLSEELPEHASTINEILNQSLSLDLRLKQLFGQFPTLHNALFVFDDFEQNFIKDNHQQLAAEAYAVITALLTAIRHTGSLSRVLITSRYTFAVQNPLQLTELELNHFEGIDLQKKVQALHETYLAAKDAPVVTQVLEQQAIKLGAGNPRLLEWLYRVLVDKSIDKTALFASLEAKQAEFREKLLLQTLLDYQSLDTRRLLASIALFEVPLPIAVFEQVFPDTELTKVLRSALALGLLENYQATFFISRLLVPLLTEELNLTEQQAIYAGVARVLDALWWESDYRHRISFEEVEELTRVAELGGEKAIFSKVGGYLSKKLLDVARHNEAKTLLDKLLPIQQEIGDRSGEGMTLNNIGEMYTTQGDYETALRYLQYSLTIFQEIGDKAHEGGALNNISSIFQAQGHYETALNHLQLCIKIFQEIGDKASQAGVFNNISQIFKALGDNKTALSYLQQSLTIIQEIGDKRGVGATFNNVATIAHACGDHKTALHCLQQCLNIFQEIGDKSGEGATLNNISQVYSALGDYKTALGYLQQCLAIFQEIGNVVGLCPTLFNIGHIHLRNEESQKGMTKFVEAYLIAKRIGYAPTLQALDKLAKNSGQDGLEFWEKLSKSRVYKA